MPCVSLEARNPLRLRMLRLNSCAAASASMLVCVGGGAYTGGFGIVMGAASGCDLLICANCCLSSWLFRRSFSLAVLDCEGPPPNWSEVAVSGQE